MTTKAPTSRRLASYLAAPALALGLALGSAGVANAVWDIGGYDYCIDQHSPGPDSTMEETAEWYRLCCVNSGGQWKRYNGYWDCYAPGVDSQGGRVPTHVMQPAPLPAPPGDIGPAPGGVVTAP